MSLTLRKLLVTSIVLMILITAHIMVIAMWLQETGIIDAAAGIRREFLTGTAITILIAMVILLVGPGSAKTGHRHGSGCDVCGHRVSSNDRYCGDCGSRQ